MRLPPLLALLGAAACFGSPAPAAGPSDGARAPVEARRAAPAEPDAGRAAAAGSGVVERGGWKVVQVLVKGSLSGAIAAAVPGDGSVLAAHAARVFMWDLDLRRDVVPGDRVTAVWRKDAAGELELGAAVYESRARSATLRAYRFKAPGDQHASYWDEGGQEWARQLKASPLRQYEQITALLKDRPTHRGMDFKTPVGTPIHAPRPGVVTRANWKLKGNGNCLEVRYDDGVIAKFLHLSALKAAPGARVRPGEIIALTGNTGRSTAPHLHYQLDRGGRTLDPIDYHGTARRRLDAAGLRAFKATRAALDPLLGG